jgi:capsule polysaccharide export protein KpsE/RkpR
MASCAACLRPIVHAHQFVLDGTEVFHRQCAGQAYRSKLRLAEQRACDLEAQLADTRRAAARVEVETHRLRNEVTAQMASVVTLEGRLAERRTQLDLAQDRLQATRSDLQAARNEAAALRAELAALKPAEQSPDEDVDATVQRFKMLELD